MAGRFEHDSESGTYRLLLTMPVEGDKMAARQLSAGSISRASAASSHRRSWMPLSSAFCFSARSFSSCKPSAPLGQR